MKFGEIEISTLVILFVVVVLYNSFIIVLALCVSQEKYERLIGIMEARTIRSPLESLIRALRKSKKKNRK